MANLPRSLSVSKFNTTEQRAEAEALFANMGDGAIATDEFGKITRVNPSATSLLGYSEKELVGSWFPKIIVAVNEDDSLMNLIDRPITKAFLMGKPIYEKMFYRHKDGHKFPVAVNVSPILIKGKPFGAIEVFRDITLEQEVDRMKSEFISLASHQLRTPLSAIKTYSHMLSDGFMGELNSSQKGALNTIIGASNRMNELISTLLNITRIESGTIAVTPKTIQINRVIEELMPELSLMATGKSIRLSMNTKGASSTTIKTDPLIVKEILTNLVSNAIKYTPDEGKVDIIIHPRRTNIQIEVHDSGWGIPKEFQDQVFSKFFRAQNIVKRETTGTGLGLYLVKGLVDALGGEIWFTSDENVGTSFYFTIPRAKRTPPKPKTKVKLPWM
ncbi:MAG: ATP-binding protein [Candidatus Saccharimonadales bacterium]